MKNTARLIAAVLLAASVLTVPVAAYGAPGDVGSEGPSHAGTGTPTGAKRAESVLWFNDGSWWGNLWDTRTLDFHIFRFEETRKQWVDTGVTTETRANTHHDVLWDGTTLSVASHMFVADGVAAVAGNPSTLRRYGYNTATDTYTLLGSSRINEMRTESLVIDKDRQGQLWATWQQGNQIFVNNTGTDGATWGTPFPLPGGSVSVDDTSALIAFGGRVGILWSRQSSTPAPSDGFYWSVHVDGATRTEWTEPVAAVTGARSGDDHMNLKWLDASGGRVFAAVKTSFSSAAQPLIQLLAMDSTGTWSQTTIATVSECPNRVIVLIDEAAQRLRTFATYPKPSGTTNAGACSSSGGAIYEKSTPLDNIKFTTDKTPRIVDADQLVHNVSSTKQNLNNALSGGASTANSGLMIIAHVARTSTYWYYNESGGATPPPADTTPPETTITAGPTGAVTATGATFEFTSSEAGSTFECQLDAEPFTTCTSPKSYPGLADGQHTFSVRASDAAGNTDATPATRTWTIGSADTSPPETAITAGPSGTVTTTDATFEFTSSEAGSSFECQLDAAGYAACTSPMAHLGLADGQHTFDVRARDAAGNTDPTPATRTWTVVTTPPSAGIVRSASSSAVNTTAATALRIAQPSGVVAGDVLVGCVTLNGGSMRTEGVPAGWSPLASLTSLANPKVYGYFKIATSDEPTEYVWTTTSTTGGGVVARYSGAAGLDTAAASASGAAASSGTVGPVTTTTANAMLVGCMGVNSSSATLSSPAGMTEIVETGARRFELADGLEPTVGPSGTKTWTFSSTREWAGWLVALRPR
jgi:hypothetical protein